MDTQFDCFFNVEELSFFILICNLRDIYIIVFLLIATRICNYQIKKDEVVITECTRQNLQKEFVNVLILLKYDDFFSI